MKKLWRAGATQRRRELFDRLIRPHVAGMFKTAYRLTGTRDDAEDLVQDVLTKLYPQTDALSEVVDLMPWLARALHNRYVDIVRKRVRSPVAVADEANYRNAVDPRASPVDRAENEELGAALHRALDTLAPELRSLVAMHLMEGKTLEQLTEVFDVPLGTLKSRLHTARSRLKKVLALDEPFGAGERVTEYELQRSEKSAQRYKQA